MGALRPKPMNPDVLREICSRLDDVTLIKFARNARLWKEVTAMLGDDLFWKMRAEYAAGKPLTARRSGRWRDIYYAVLAYLEHGYEHALQDLDLLLILFQIREPSQDEFIALSGEVGVRMSAEVFRCLIERRLVTYGSDTDIEEQILFLSRQDVNVFGEAEVGPILVGMLDTVHYLPGLTQQLARAGYTNTLQAVLEKYGSSNANLAELAKEALLRERDVTALMLIERADLDQGMIGHLMGIALESPIAVRSARALIELDPEQSRRIGYRESMLDEAIRDGDANGVPLILRHTNLTYLNHSAMLAAKILPSALPPLLSDSRVSARGLLGSILSELLANKRESNALVGNLRQSLDLVLQSERLKVQELNDSDMRQLLRVSPSGVEGKVEACILANVGMQGMLDTEEEVEDALLEKGLYSTVLRYIVFKQPDNVGLIDWMIELDDRRLTTAASLVLSDRWSRNAKTLPFEVLLWSLLYPTLTLEELDESMLSAGIDPVVIAEALQLVNAQRWGQKRGTNEL